MTESSEAYALSNVVETALAKALVLAAEAKRWDVVAQVTAELVGRRVGVSRTRRPAKGARPLSHAAEQILSQRATPADRRTLEAAEEAALAAGEMYRLCAMVEGLTVIAAVESLPFLTQTYEQVP